MSQVHYLLAKASSTQLLGCGNFLSNSTVSLLLDSHQQKENVLTITIKTDFLLCFSVNIDTAQITDDDLNIFNNIIIIKYQYYLNIFNNTVLRIFICYQKNKKCTM